METVSLKKGWIYKIERFFFSHTHEAQDTCTLRWRLIKIILSIPIFFMTWVYLRLTKFTGNFEDAGKHAIGIKTFSLFLISILTFAFLTNEDGNLIYSLEIAVWMSIGAFLFSSLITAIMAGVVIVIILPLAYLIKIIVDYREKVSNKKETNKDKKDRIIKTLYKSAKEKYCVKIEWMSKK